MSKDITLTLDKRTVEGKAVRGLRREGIVPAVIHDHGKDSVIVEGQFIAMTKAYKAAGKHHTVEVSVDGKKYVTLIKDVDFEPRKNTIRHIVFNAIAADEKQQTEVPVHYIEGEIPAEKAGHMVIRSLDVIEIEALPKDLIDELRVDVSGLVEIGDRVTVADVKVPNGVVILTDLEHPIAVVEETKAEMSEEDEAASGDAADVPSENGGDGPASTEEKAEDGKS